MDMKKFANEIIALMRDHPGDDLPGDEIWEITVRNGLMTPHTVSEPCAPCCFCDLWESQFPTVCYRPNELLGE